MLQAQLDAAARQMPPPMCAFLLSSGRFEGLRAPDGIRLIRPFEVAAAFVDSLEVPCAILCVPTEAQRLSAAARWRARLPPTTRLQAIVLPEDPTQEELRLAAEEACWTQVASAADGATLPVVLILDSLRHGARVRHELRGLLPASSVVIDVGAAALGQLQASLL